MHIFPINTYSNFGRPSTQWPNRRAKMKNMFFCWILDPKSYLFIVIVEWGNNSIHETAWKLEHFWWIPLIHIDTIIILFGYRIGLDRHQNVSNSTSEIATTRCLKCGLQSQFQKQVSSFVFWVNIVASSLETIGGDVIIGPSTTIKSEGHCGPPTFRWNVLVRATLLTGVWGEGKVSFGESMGKVYCFGRYSVVETIQIKLVGSSMNWPTSREFFWKWQKFDHTM